MPTHDGENRSFDFADLASEGIAGVQVYKTGNADIPTGGIGSTINIQTTKPLETWQQLVWMQRKPKKLSCEESR